MELLTGNCQLEYLAPWNCHSELVFGRSHAMERLFWNGDWNISCHGTATWSWRLEHIMLWNGCCELACGALHVNEHELCSDPTSADPLCPFPIGVSRRPSHDASEKRSEGSCERSTCSQTPVRTIGVSREPCAHPGPAGKGVCSVMCPRISRGARHDLTALYIYIYIHTYLYICYTIMCIIYAHICIKYMYMYMYMYMYCICMWYVCMYVCMCTYMYVCVYIYIYIYTYIHTYITSRHIQPILFVRALALQHGRDPACLWVWLNSNSNSK